MEDIVQGVNGDNDRAIALGQDMVYMKVNIGCTCRTMYTVVQCVNGDNDKAIEVWILTGVYEGQDWVSMQDIIQGIKEDKDRALEVRIWCL